MNWVRCAAGFWIYSKALAVEKVKFNSSDEALMTTENVFFLKTVEEKMKGLVMLKILPAPKVTAVKKIAEYLKAFGNDNLTPEELELLEEMFPDDETSPDGSKPSRIRITHRRRHKNAFHTFCKFVAEIKKPIEAGSSLKTLCVNKSIIASSNVQTSSVNSTCASKSIVLDDDSDGYDIGEVFKKN